MSKRRENVPFDPYYFEKQANNGLTFSLGDTFRHIYQTNHWRGTNSVSGEGASRNQVQQIEAELPTLLKRLQVNTFLDVPCGDFSWMQFVNLPVSLYIGADIITDLIAENQKRYGIQNRQFITLDLTVDPLPTAELLLCRDCLVHFSFADIYHTLNNIKKSGIAYLLTTTFPNCKENEDITTGDWRLLNLEKPPFNFPKPLQLLNEQCSEGDGQFRDKSLGLWRMQDITI
jgi:hypothetical protein